MSASSNALYVLSVIKFPITSKRRLQMIQRMQGTEHIFQTNLLTISDCLANSSNKIDSQEWIIEACSITLWERTEAGGVIEKYRPINLLLKAHIFQKGY